MLKKTAAKVCQTVEENLYNRQYQITTLLDQESHKQWVLKFSHTAVNLLRFSWTNIIRSLLKHNSEI